MNGFILLLFTILPAPDVTEDHCDAIELNTTYDGNGNINYEQMLFKRWNRAVGEWQTVDWRMFDDHDGNGPRGCISNGVATFHDWGRLRRVRYKQLEISHTQYDPAPSNWFSYWNGAELSPSAGALRWMHDNFLSQFNKGSHE